jgi:uncharacterized protein
MRSGTSAREEEQAMRGRFSEAMKEAMRAGDKARLSTVRLIQAAVQKRDLELGDEAYKEASKGAAEGADLAGAGKAKASDDEILAVLQKMIKQRQESILLYEKAGRMELADVEKAEIAVIQSFMPAQLDEAGTAAAVAATIEATGAQSVKDLGKVMAELRAKYAGQMDFGKASALAKTRLS